MALNERLTLWASGTRKLANKLPPGPKRDKLVMKARQADMASHLRLGQLAGLAGSEVTRPPEYDSQDVQVLKLLKAFFQVENAATRHLIVALTESVVSGASEVKYFALQEPSEKKLN